MLLAHLPYRLRIRLAGRLFYLAHRRKIEFRGGPPLLDGHWPKVSNEGRIVIGANCFIRAIMSPPHLATLRDGTLDIGPDAFINEGVNICSASAITIGAAAKLANMVAILDTDFHAVAPDVPVRKKPIVIGRNVWIGAHALVLPGASIGDHSVIAAGSVVTGAIPSRCVAAGSPARVIRTFEAPDDWVRG